jgi:uncharacterized membrane protein (DUF4010 family)
MTNITPELIVKIIYALGIGILIGLERSIGQSSETGDRASCREDPEEALALKNSGDEFKELIGVRTYTVLSVVGFSAALLGKEYPLATPVLMGGTLALILLMYWRHQEIDYGITTEAAAIGTCGLGALCYINPQASGVIALIMTIILASKRFTRKTVGRIRRVELTDTLKFLVVIFILLPILPDRPLDVYGAFNPYKVTFLIILISGISFVGYFLTKFLGAEKGLGLTGFLGGLTSSTAVTAAMSNQVKAAPGLMGACAFATILANATMFGRVLVVVAILDRVLAQRLVWSMGTMTLTACISVFVLWTISRKKRGQGKQTSGELALSNPFSLGPAIKFALFFVMIIFAAKIAKLYLGNSGLYLASLVSGLADVDAITLSIAGETQRMQLDYSTAAIGITIAVVSNSIVKSSIAFYSGGARFGILVGSILLASTGAGLLVLLLL